MRFRKGRLFLTSVVLVLLVLGLLAWRFGWFSSDGPPDNAYVGLTKQEIITRLGAPADQWAGGYGNPNYEWAQQFEPCETLTYKSWKGTLYISVYQKDGQWVCFCSTWLPRGGVF